MVSLNNYGMKFDYVSLDLHHAENEIFERNVETEYEHKFAAKEIRFIVCMHILNKLKMLLLLEAFLFSQKYP